MRACVVFGSGSLRGTPLMIIPVSWRFGGFWQVPCVRNREVQLRGGLGVHAVLLSLFC